MYHMPIVNEGAVIETVAPVVTTAQPDLEAAAPAFSDAVASAQLKALFVSYGKIRRGPKLPAEVPVLRHLSEDNHDAIQYMLDESVVAFHAWVEQMQNLLFTMQEIGLGNPGAAISIIGGKTKRTVQVNGTRLFEALLRTDGEILSGKLS
jgi:hypothetical protein